MITLGLIQLRASPSPDRNLATGLARIATAARRLDAYHGLTDRLLDH